MKAYGLPSFGMIDYPDLQDVKEFALKGYKVKNRKSTRRTFKKKERQKAKKDVCKYLLEENI